MVCISLLALALAVANAAPAPPAPTCDATTGNCYGAGQPHGGKLVNTYVADESQRKALKAECTTTLELSQRQACDVALLVSGGFSPLVGFMTKDDYEGVVENMKATKAGVIFGLPVVLDITDPSIEGKKV